MPYDTNIPIDVQENVLVSPDPPLSSWVVTKFVNVLDRT